jgi:hypothetical protein
MPDEFSVYWWDKDGTQHEELRLVSAEEAVKAAKRLTEGPDSQAGIVRRVIVTDGEDYCNYEWRDGRVTWDGRELPGDDDDYGTGA